MQAPLMAVARIVCRRGAGGEEGVNRLLAQKSPPPDAQARSAAGLERCQAESADEVASVCNPTGPHGVEPGQLEGRRA